MTVATTESSRYVLLCMHAQCIVDHNNHKQLTNIIVEPGLHRLTRLPPAEHSEATITFKSYGFLLSTYTQVFRRRWNDSLVILSWNVDAKDLFALKNEGPCKTSHFGTFWTYKNLIFMKVYMKYANSFWNLTEVKNQGPTIVGTHYGPTFTPNLVGSEL